MSSPTQDLPGLQDYFIRKDRELHDRLEQLHEARKHLQMFPELKDSVIEKDNELQKQLTQLSEASKHLKDTSTLNVSEQAKSACPVNNVGTQDDRSVSPHVATVSTSREQRSQQPSNGHIPELISRPKTSANKSPADPEGTPQNFRSKPSEAVSCAECGKKFGRLPSALNQRCSKCRSEEVHLPVLNSPAAMEGRGQSREGDRHHGDNARISHTAKTMSPTPNVGPIERQRRDTSKLELPTNKSGTKVGRTETVRRLVNALDGNHQPVSTPSNEGDDAHLTTTQPKDFTQLDAKRYPTVVWFDGAYRDFCCFECGGNVTDFDDTAHQSFRPPGTWRKGMRGLHSHIANKHHTSLTNHGFDAGVRTLTWCKVAHVCVENNAARRVHSDDVKRIKAGREPKVPIVKKVSFDKTFAQAEHEHRNGINLTPAARSPAYKITNRAGEEAVDRLMQTDKLFHNLNTRAAHRADSTIHNDGMLVNDFDEVEGNSSNFAHSRNISGNARQNLKRSKGGSKVVETSDYESDEDEDEDDNALLVPKRRRVSDHTYASDMGS